MAVSKSHSSWLMILAILSLLVLNHAEPSESEPPISPSDDNHNNINIKNENKLSVGGLINGGRNLIQKMMRVDDHQLMPENYPTTSEYYPMRPHLARGRPDLARGRPDGARVRPVFNRMEPEFLQWRKLPWREVDGAIYGINGGATRLRLSKVIWSTTNKAP